MLTGTYVPYSARTKGTRQTRRHTRTAHGPRTSGRAQSDSKSARAGGGPDTGRRTGCAPGRGAWHGGVTAVRRQLRLRLHSFHCATPCHFTNVKLNGDPTGLPRNAP
jgi:hypothetical protein